MKGTTAPQPYIRRTLGAGHIQGEKHAHQIEGYCNLRGAGRRRMIYMIKSCPKEHERGGYVAVEDQKQLETLLEH